MTKETALAVLYSTIKEMQQSLTTMDDNNVWCDVLCAEICLMNELYKNLCKQLPCKNYGSDLRGFVDDLLRVTQLHSLKINDTTARFIIYDRTWEIKPWEDSLEITYSDNVGVGGVELKHGRLFSAEALVILDVLTIEIFERIDEIIPLLREETKKRGQYEDDLKNSKHVYELTSLVLLDHNFPVRACKRISHCTFSSLKKAEENKEHFDPGIYHFPANYADCIGHFIERIDVDCQWSRDIAKSFYPDQTMHACNIYPKDKVTGCKEEHIRHKKGDLVWCVNGEWRDHVRLGIVYALPHSDTWYKRRLAELQEVFGTDYAFEMDEDFYLVFFLDENENGTSGRSFFFQFIP